MTQPLNLSLELQAHLDSLDDMQSVSDYLTRQYQMQAVRRTAREAATGNVREHGRAIAHEALAGPWIDEEGQR